MRLSQRVQAIQPSVTLAITARAKALQAAGERVLPMAAGEPDFPTPAPIREACVRALEAGHTGYAPSAGIPELRAAVRKRVQAELGLAYGDDQVVVSCGAKHCLFNAMQSLLGPGDRGLVQSPYWVSYPAQMVLAGAEPVLLPIPASGAGLNRPALEAALGERTRVLVLNSPCNPSGHVLSADDIDYVAGLARQNDLTIVSDDIYDQLIYGPERPAHILRRHPDLQDRVIVVHGVSKTYSMTGWRLGYALGPKPVIAAMRKVQDQSTSNATTFVQHAAITALESPPALVAGMLAAFAERRKRIVAGLSGLPGLRCQAPDGAFYAFPDVSGLLARSLDGQAVGSALRLAELLLERERVACVPGEAFGAPGYLRFSFACSLEVIDEAIVRLGRFIARLG
ncbi:MAG TPA: pyridoxal phosphate-dependent aminotransferase [Myxococcota bacterium]|nr:pyridoxal phosphate-dependent aminotransferase [Myxococcota bacterium]HRY96360.1 pyridoxal phosphate-dependent aminotransferase [Myxococcota bacterium]HSA20787.1 pyridoxal phosphate-dependent aminotransferase [Myxococcota bacterium]